MDGHNDTHNTQYLVHERQNILICNKEPTLQNMAPTAINSPSIETFERSPSSTIVTPQRDSEESYNSTTNDNISTMDAIVTCSSSATEDMLDTVDDCVGCVNQIALQHEYEETLPVDLPFATETYDQQQQKLHCVNNNSVQTFPSEDDTMDNISSVHEFVSLLQSKDSSVGGSIKLEDDCKVEGVEMDLLNWCGGVFKEN